MVHRVMKTPEGNLFVISEAHVHINGHVVEVPERGNSAQFTIRECVLKFLLRRDLNCIAAGENSQAIQVDMSGGRDHRHGEDPIDFEDYGFGQLFAGNMGQSGHTLRGVGERVRDDQVLDVVRVEIFANFGKRHTTSPLEW